MSASSKKLVSFLKKQFWTERKQGACVKLVLHHIVASGKLGAAICTVNPLEGLETGARVDEDAIDNYAAEIESDANDYAEGVGQTQTFVVAAYYEEDEDAPGGRFAFTVKVEEDTEGDEVLTEPASMPGILKQLMRHNEAHNRMNSAAFGSVLNILRQQNEQLSAMVSSMYESRVHEIEAVEELISAKHVRDIETKRQEISAAHSAQVVDNLLALLPAVGNKLMGRKILPETTDPIQLQIAKFAEALTPAEVEKLYQAVDAPEKKIALIELLKLVSDRVGATPEDPNGTKPS